MLAREQKPPLPHSPQAHRDRQQLVSQRETDQDLVPEPQDEVEERFQNEKQRGSLEASGRPAESTPSPLRSRAFPCRFFLSRYLGGKNGGWSAGSPPQTKALSLGIAHPYRPQVPAGLPAPTGLPSVLLSTVVRDKFRRGPPPLKARRLGTGRPTGKDRASCQSGGAPALPPGAVAQSPGREAALAQIMLCTLGQPCKKGCCCC